MKRWDTFIETIFFYPYALYAVFINDINLHLRQYFTIKRSINKFTRTRKYPNESD